MRRPTVSVLMNCLNGARYLKEALDSVYAQTYEDWEIIFWDDASTDASATIALQSHFPDTRLRYFRGAGGQPLGAARNQALAQCCGRYVALLDCDDLWMPTKLQRQLAYIENRPQTGMLFADCLYVDADGNSIGSAFARTPPPSGLSVYAALLERPNFIPSPTILWRTDALRKVNGFPLTYRYAETFAACLRIAQQFVVDWIAPASYLSAIVASYRIHRGNRGGTGCHGMTKEVLQEMALHRVGAGWRQYLREGMLWARYGGQLLAGS